MNTPKTLSLSLVPFLIGSALLACPYPIPSQPPDRSECNTGSPSDISLATSQSPILRKLSEYETICKGTVTDTLMIFTGMPRTVGEAAEFAEYMAASLQEFSAHHITPLVLFEPSMAEDFELASVHRGEYDAALQTYYTTLRSKGISDKQMGTWVLFPEANTPIWKTTRPDDFVANVIHTGTIQKSVFPDSKLSILLGSQTYPDHDTEWGHGTFKSLAPYVSALPKGLIDSFGYQGFPSVAEAGAAHQYRQVDAHEFLPSSLASEAAGLLGTKKIWINTGTFSIMYARQPGEVKVKTSERSAILDSVLAQARDLQATEFTVSINLFAEDKSSMNEGVDWSYWRAGHTEQSPSTDIFMRFVHDIRKNGLGFSLYDSFPTSG